MARAKVKAKKYRTVACKFLEQMNEVSNSGSPLCRCTKRELVMSPYNIICQLCVLYRRNSAGIIHEELFVADDAPDFVYNIEELNLRINVNMNPTDEDDIFGRFDSDEEEDDDEEEYDFEEEIEGPVIGVEEDEEEDELDYHDEAEEAFIEDDEFEDDEYEEDIFGDEDELLDGDDGFVAGVAEEETSEGPGIDFEEEVLSKIKDLGDKELCPFCKKAKKSVVRHLYRCNKCPEEIKEALKVWKKNQSEGKPSDEKEPASSKAASKKAAPKKAAPKKKTIASKAPSSAAQEISWDDSYDYVDSKDEATGGLVYFGSQSDKFVEILNEKDQRLKRKKVAFKSIVERTSEMKDGEFLEFNLEEMGEISVLLRSDAKEIKNNIILRYIKK